MFFNAIRENFRIYSIIGLEMPCEPSSSSLIFTENVRYLKNKRLSAAVMTDPLWIDCHIHCFRSDKYMGISDLAVKKEDFFFFKYLMNENVLNLFARVC